MCPSPSFLVITASELAYDNGAIHMNFYHMNHVWLTSSGPLDNCLLSTSSQVTSSQLINSGIGYLSPRLSTAWVTYNIFLEGIPFLHALQELPAEAEGLCSFSNNFVNPPFLEKDLRCLASLPSNSRLPILLSQHWIQDSEELL